jgi:hypothetical protein
MMCLLWMNNCVDWCDFVLLPLPLPLLLLCVTENAWHGLAKVETNKAIPEAFMLTLFYEEREKEERREGVALGATFDVSHEAWTK